MSILPPCAASICRTRRDWRLRHSTATFELFHDFSHAMYRVFVPREKDSRILVEEFLGRVVCVVVVFHANLSDADAMSTADFARPLPLRPGWQALLVSRSSGAPVMWKSRRAQTFDAQAPYVRPVRIRSGPESRGTHLGSYEDEQCR